MKIVDLCHAFKPYRWRLLGFVLGLATAVSFMTLGFWRTVLLVLCCGIGYAVGFMRDKKRSPLILLRYWRERLD